MKTNANLIKGRLPVFGNWEQIKANRRHLRKSQGLEPVTKFHPHKEYGYGIKFTPFDCLNNRCKQTIHWIFFINVLMDGDDIVCPNCDAVYEVREATTEADFGIYYKQDND